MVNQFNASTKKTGYLQQPWCTAHSVSLIIIWIVTTSVIVTMLLQGVRDKDQFSIARYVMQVSYVLILLLYLHRTGPSLNQLPDLRSFVFPRWRYGKLIPAFVVALLLVMHGFPDLGGGYMALLLMISTVWILVAWRREIRLRMLLSGVAVALIALLAGLPFWINDFIAKPVFIVFLIFVPPMFIAGWLLFKRTNLGGIQLLTGGCGKAFQSFLRGCFLFVPLGLINAVDDSPGAGMSWVTDWWIPFSQPWFSGIVEEAWFRLLLVGLCYFLLRPVFPKHPALAVFCAVLFSAVTFGLGHGGTLNNLLTTGLLYGLPMAMVFVRRDWEHAVGAHYMINMIPTFMYYLET